MSPTGSWTVFTVAAIAACALIFSAGAQNVAHGWSLGAASSEFRAVVLAAASAGASILGPLCWLAVARGRGFGTRCAALLLALGCLAYASVCSLGFVAGSRDKAVSEQVVSADAYADKRALAEAAREELKALKGKNRRTIERRRELMKLLDETSTARGMAAPVQADAQAAALGFYIRAAGWQIGDSAVSTWLSLGTTLFLELAAALSLTVAASLRPVPAPVQEEQPKAPQPEVRQQPVPEPQARQEKRKEDDDKDDAPPPRAKAKGKGGRPRDVLPAQAVERLRAAGGRASGSINGVAKLIGSRSKTSCHRLLGELRDMGLIRLETSPRGCTVALACG